MGVVMKNKYLFDLRGTSKALKYANFERIQVRNDLIWLLFISLILVLGSFIWTFENKPPMPQILLLSIINITGLITLVFALYIEPKKRYEKKIILPLIDSDNIVKENSSRHIIEKYPLSTILQIYLNPHKEFITILLTKKSQEGYTIIYVSKRQIIDLKLFISILKNKQINIKNENASSEIINEHKKRYNQ